MTLKSRKKLKEVLAEVYPHVNYPSFETYGNHTFAYISFESHTQRLEAEALLAKRGFKVDKRYWPESATTKIQVSYFKTMGWDE